MWDNNINIKSFQKLRKITVIDKHPSTHPSFVHLLFFRIVLGFSSWIINFSILYIWLYCSPPLIYSVKIAPNCVFPPPPPPRSGSDWRPWRSVIQKPFIRLSVSSITWKLEKLKMSMIYKSLEKDFFYWIIEWILHGNGCQSVLWDKMYTRRP